MIANRLHAIGWLSLLLLCIVPTHVNADVVQQDYHASVVRKTLVIAGFTAALLACSEDVQAVTAEATLSSAIICLRLLLKAPLSHAMKQKIQAKIDCLEIDYLEMVNTTRAGKIPTPGGPILRILKVIKDTADAFKAAEWVAVLAGILAATTK
jgi:hypothetical protein